MGPRLRTSPSQSGGSRRGPSLAPSLPASSLSFIQMGPHDQRSRMARRGHGSVLRVDREGDLAGERRLDGTDAADLNVRIRRIKPGAQLARKFFELHTNGSWMKTCLNA